MSLFSNFMMGTRQLGKVDDIFTTTSSLFSKTAFREAADGSALKGLISKSDDVQEVTSEFFQRSGNFYRIIVGDDAFQDIVTSGLVRTNSGSKVQESASIASKLAARPTKFPSFSKDSASMQYAQQNPNHYIIVSSDKSIQASKSGRHGLGTTHFPTDESGAHLESLAADKVKVYRHSGEGKYQLAYDKTKKMVTKTNNGVLTNNQVNQMYTSFSIDRTYTIPNLFDLSANATGNTSVRRLAGVQLPTNIKPHHGSRRMGGY